MLDTVIEVKDLLKAYGNVQAVNGISFGINTGEIFAMLGPNGAGKSTTVEIIEGLRNAHVGSVIVLGMDIFKNTMAVKERIGVQSQSPALFPDLKVKEIINFFRSLYRKSVPVSEVIKLASLQESQDVLFRNLSGGQQQRLSVAVAFIYDPEIVILDEPTTGFFTNTFAVEAFNLDTADGKQSDNNCILRSVLWARSFALRLVKQYDLCFGLFHSELVNNKKYSFQHITS